MAHNLCYTTLLDKGTVEKLGLVRDVDYIQTPNNGTLRPDGSSLSLTVGRRLVRQAIKEAWPLTYDIKRLDLRQKESQGGFEERNGSFQEGCAGR